MTDFEPQEDLPPVAHVTIVYSGPIAPHWELQVRYGDQKFVDDFWARVNARLLLLPKHDPQFRRNKERVNRDAERERITCDWDLGENDSDTSITPVVEPVAEVAESAPVDVEGNDAPATETEVAQDAAVESDEAVDVVDDAVEVDETSDDTSAETAEDGDDNDDEAEVSEASTADV